MLEIGEKMPTFEADAFPTGKLSAEELKGKKALICFYPRDNTPGCTVQAQDFRDAYAKFKKLGVAVIGISRDSLKSHQNFCGKYDLPFPLIADTDEALCNAFGVIKQKNMYGKKVFGIERSTFLFDAHGVLRHAWRGVKIPEHVQDVLGIAKTLD